MIDPNKHSLINTDSSPSRFGQDTHSTQTKRFFMKHSRTFLSSIFTAALLFGACTSDTGTKSNSSAPAPVTNLNEENARNEREARETQRILAELQAKLAKLESDAQTSSQATSGEIGALKSQITLLQSKLTSLRSTIDSLENKILEKISSGGLAQNNIAIMQESMANHTSVYTLKGTYNVLVIPVEFAAEENFDGRFVDASRFTSGLAQEELFGNNPNSMHSYYQHISGGMLNVTGKVVEPVRVEKPLTFYGKAITGSKDERARDLVVDSLKKLKERMGEDESFWKKFDTWDLNDLDRDGIYTEADGFIDAVVLVYAGKEQSSCQSIFDPQNKQPASDDVAADDPRKKQALECYNRIWPHRSSIFLPKDSPDFPTVGPKLEGEDRGALGFRITDSLYAFDYNMQSEFSDISTFTHEFGHSLTLPDLYAVQGGDNNVGTWDIMAQNARNFGQEMTAYHRMALGWLAPKIVNEGETTSAYLGSMNFVTPTKRESYSLFQGPELITQLVRGIENKFSITSTVPETNEPVYSAIAVRMKPSKKTVKEIDFPAFAGTTAAYSGRFDNGTRAIKFSVDVPESGSAMLSFDTVYHIETETNFNSRDPEIRVITDYDLGAVKINGETKDQFRLLSGDENFDTLVEKNPACDANSVLELRKKIVSGAATSAEKSAFKTKLAPCAEPAWVKKSYDLSAFRGQKVRMEIAYITDPGYNEFGIFVDNIKLGESALFDFEDGLVPNAEWFASVNGTREVKSSQFYMLEYRDPTETFTGSGSLNLDQNMQGNAGMAMFLGKDAGATARERFRLVTLHHQPGVLGWYFDSTYDRRSNTPELENQPGRGYYLPINSKLRELTVPGVFASSAFQDSNGFYNTALPAFQQTAAAQGAEFKCFGYPEYSAYLDGKAPDCSGFDSINTLGQLRIGSRTLHFSRDSGNNYLPSAQRNHFQVSSPGWLVSRGNYLRSSVQTFRAPEMGDFAPLKVWKANAAGEMELDTELTAQATIAKPMSTFRDAESSDAAPHLKDKRFLANRATVNVRGFNFRVVSPDAGIISRYNSTDADSNNSTFRKPKAKILIHWEPVQ
jgi:immune inhibitor A